MIAIALRPRGVVELLDLMVAVYRAAWRPILTASALLIVPLFALDSLVAVVGAQRLGLLYFDLRVRREGLDLEVDMASLAPTPAEPRVAEPRAAEPRAAEPRVADALADSVPTPTTAG